MNQKIKGNPVAVMDRRILGDVEIPNNKDLRIRWVNDDEASISRRIQQGWQVVNETNVAGVISQNKKQYRRVTEGEGSLDATIRRGGMIAMFRPDEMSREYENEIRRINKSQMEAIDPKNKRSFSNEQIKSYGETKISRSDVLTID